VNGTVIVTGAGQGLGRAFATALAAAGRPVAVADINLERAESVAAEITAARGSAAAVCVDVADAPSAAAMVAETTARLGVPEVLINNAAVFSTLRMKPITEISPDEWDQVVKVNLGGAFLCAQAVIPAMQAAGYGKIVNISSATVWTGRSGYPHYVASKAGLIGLTRALASELGPIGIRVNAVSPGSTETEVERETITREARNAMAGQTALRRVQVADDVVGAVVFLSSPESDFITGQTINVDGGYAFH
jgi:3-oxoacyl-[acyl-carrier protein] reductase